MGEKSEKKYEMIMARDQLTLLFKDFVSQWDKIRTESAEPEVDVSDLRKLKMEIKKLDDNRFSVKMKLKKEKPGKVSVEKDDDDDDDDESDKAESLKDFKKLLGKQLKQISKSFSEDETPAEEIVLLFLNVSEEMIQMMRDEGDDCTEFLAARDEFAKAWELKDLYLCREKCDVLNQQKKICLGK